VISKDSPVAPAGLAHRFHLPSLSLEGRDEPMLARRPKPDGLCLTVQSGFKVQIYINMYLEKLHSELGLLSDLRKVALIVGLVRYAASGLELVAVIVKIRFDLAQSFISCQKTFGPA
jgi:hypothetical protein